MKRLTTRLDHLDCLLVVAGLSGAGKSTALDTLADAGFATIDNLPIPLVPHFIKLSGAHPLRYKRTALLLNIEAPDTLQQLLTILDKLNRPKNVHLLFLDAATPAIIRRYSETRRPHPGFDPTKDRTLEDAISRERETLQLFKERAHATIDSTTCTVHDLRRSIKRFVESLTQTSAHAVRVNFVSFGFKYGVPLDCDLLADVRFIPNPYFVPELRERSGNEPEVASFVIQADGAAEFIERYLSLIHFLLPRYLFEGKSYVNIGIGCTGGKHRSVAIANEFARLLNHDGSLVSVTHRDCERS
jgi:UPF0042 nucleotide-binding protein